MKRSLVTGVLFLALAASALAADTRTDYDHSVNFTQYKSFAWKEPKNESNDIVRNSLVMARIRASVQEHLGSKGLKLNTAAPDLYILAHVAAERVRDIDYLPPLGNWRYWGWMEPDLIIRRYVEGTIILDMVDAKTNRLVWRAISTDTGSDLLKVQSADRVDDMIEDSLEDFPPKTGVLSGGMVR